MTSHIDQLEPERDYRPDIRNGNLPPPGAEVGGVVSTVTPFVFEDRIWERIIFQVVWLLLSWRLHTAALVIQVKRQIPKMIPPMQLMKQNLSLTVLPRPCRAKTNQGRCGRD